MLGASLFPLRVFVSNLLTHHQQVSWGADEPQRVMSPLLATGQCTAVYCELDECINMQLQASTRGFSESVDRAVHRYKRESTLKDRNDQPTSFHVELQLDSFIFSTRY